MDRLLRARFWRIVPKSLIFCSKHLKCDPFRCKENTNETEIFTFEKHFMKHYKSTRNKWDAVVVDKVSEQTSFERIS